MPRAILLISCPDRKGITATVTGFIYKHNGNILHADQHIDEQTNTFFMRIEWSLDGFALAREKISSSFADLAKSFDMRWNLYFTDHVSRMAIFASKPLHCLYDILLRVKSGQLSCQLPLIISNHREAEKVAKDFGIAFAEFPVTPANKLQQEQKEIELLKHEKIDLIVLARYHQILSPGFIKEFPNQIINIHHSFLPAFAGKNPYEQAYQRGVKIIGATSHYVVEELDQGPIIEQDTVRISHRDSLEDLMRKGEDLEKSVLSRAIRLHLEKKILCYNNKTVVFD